MLENTPRQIDRSAATTVELTASHKRTVDSNLVNAVLQALSREQSFLNRFVEQAGKSSLAVHVALTGKKGAQCELAFRGGKFSVTLPQRAKNVSAVEDSVEQRFLECAIKEELVALGAEYVLEGGLGDEASQVVRHMAKRYCELTGKSFEGNSALWRSAIDQHRTELESVLKNAAKRILPCIATGSDSTTNEKVQQVLQTLAEERAISLLLGASHDLTLRIESVIGQVQERFASALWHQRTDEAKDCVASLRLLQQGLKTSVFDRALPQSIRPDKPQQTRGRSIRELVSENYLQRQEFTTNRHLFKNAGDVAGMRTMIGQLAKTCDEALEFENRVRASWCQEDQAFESIMENLLDSTTELGLALSEDKPDRAQIVSQALELLVGLRLSGNENGAVFFTFAFSGYSPMDGRMQVQQVSPQVFANAYVDFLSQASSIYMGTLDPREVRNASSHGLADIAARTFRVLVFAYENSLADQLAARSGVPAEKLDFITRDIDNIEAAIDKVARYASSDELRVVFETGLSDGIGAVRAAIQQLHRLTLSGEELIAERELANDHVRQTPLGDRISEVDQTLQERVREYVDAVGKAAFEELPNIVDGTSLVTLVDHIAKLTRLTKAHPNTERDTKLFTLANSSLKEMVDVVRQGYGSEVDLVKKLAELGTEAEHVSYVLRALEALGTMVTELSYLRGHLRDVEELDSHIFTKADIFIDQVPKHFSLQIRKYPGVLAGAIKRLDGSETGGEEMLTDQQRAMCLRGLKTLTGIRHSLGEAAYASLTRLWRETQ